MILDSGVCTVYLQFNTSEPGSKPGMADQPFCRGWYGELAFETAPSHPTDAREELRTDRRVRILQLRCIANRDRVDLGPFGGPVRSYRVTRAYHGTDDDSGEPITDLTLEVYTP